jgi:hypothetical protein
MGGVHLPNITFRFSKNSESNNKSYEKTIKLYNNLINDMIDEKNIIIINTYLEGWINCILSHPSLLNDDHLTEFFTSALFPNFVIIASIQIEV